MIDTLDQETNIAIKVITEFAKNYLIAENDRERLNTDLHCIRFLESIDKQDLYFSEYNKLKIAYKG